MKTNLNNLLADCTQAVIGAISVVVYREDYALFYSRREGTDDVTLVPCSSDRAGYDGYPLTSAIQWLQGTARFNGKSDEYEIYTHAG